eukprot:CAMPEP_0114361984 /NCGR_PEP_ID=MMETSP0101-20121206/25245_1 /TAXON_ID=38822 ORGANISM="Pteridomonas danica, Strain PT" /NCGR_SAMPLE_ID=MMETSP0101 /ASSEMBLY_ACC=CAM_ASM_000211 /LENGTH=407 /DNA_ID=CAMNT_0001507437 /DNA_START=11 /DNA_END=1238 /DNA_ORIENTATION=+
MNHRSQSQYSQNPRKSSGVQRPVGGVMPWQLTAKLNKKSSRLSQRNGTSNTGSSRQQSTSTGNFNSAQFQQRLIGDMHLSLALPRSRPDRTALRSTSSNQIIMNETGWKCSICGASNSWRDGESCNQCLQSAVLSSVGTRNTQLSQQVATNHRLRNQMAPKPSNLSAEQWATLELRATDRQEGVIAEPCPICLEDFKRGVAQVLLSCTHIFHTTCLRSFESFQGRDTTIEKPACPVCRAVDYEQRATELGGVAHGHLKASKIQALARGVAMRTRYASIVRDWINGGGGDEQRRRRYIATEMSRLNEQFLTDSIADDSLDALLAASDDALALSHSVFRQDTEFDIEGPTAKTGSTVNMSLAGVRVEWFEVLSRARERSDQECAICMNDFSLFFLDATTKKKKKRRRTV